MVREGFSAESGLGLRMREVSQVRGGRKNQHVKVHQGLLRNSCAFLWLGQRQQAAVSCEECGPQDREG